MRQIDWLAVTMLLLFAAALRIIGISYGGVNPAYFPSYAPYGMVHEQLPIQPDEYINVATPVNMALRKRLNPDFFEYPSLVMNSNLVLFTLTGSLDGYMLEPRAGRSLRNYAEHRLYVLSRLYSLAGGMLQVACAYAIGRMLAGRYAALCSGLLVAVCFTLVQHAHYIKPGTLATGWMMLAAWAALASLHAQAARARFRMILLAGIATGLAATTRYNAVAIAPLVVAIGSILAYRHRAEAFWRRVFAAWLLMPLVFFAGSPYILRDFGHFWQDFSYIVGQFTTTGANVADHFLVDHMTGLAYIVLYTAVLGLGIPALAFAALSLVACWRGAGAGRAFSRGSSRWGVALIAGLVVLYAAVALRTIRPGHSDNLGMLMMPFVATLAGIGAGWLVERLPLPQRISMPAVLLLLIIQPLTLSLQVIKVFSLPDTRSILMEFVHEHIQPGARFFLNGPYNLPLDEAIYPHTQQFVVYAPTLPSGAEYDYLVYSDALAFDILRSVDIVPPAVIQHQHEILAAHDAAYTRVAEIDRAHWLGSEAMMNTASYWHHPRLILYCLNPASCEAFD